ncbi:host-nuclease inhibitor Gam family protein [Enterococcus sp. 22-H-5-01]|uniref:host-nuclease inhibitor Gam family protein n=1 Tax=Enterococcus sp. 22-H-5-01 TaxID=3418555 RepID=UPI003D08534A
MKMNALERYELEDLEKSNVRTEETQSWQVDSIESADWAFRKILALKKANEEVKQFADKEHERLEDWERKETTSNHESIEFFQHKLAEYLHVLRKTDKKAKVKTPHGVVSTRKQPDLWEYQTDAVDKLKKLGLAELIETKESVKKQEFKKVVSVLPNGTVVSPDGELIDFVKVTPQEEKIVIKEV